MGNTYRIFLENSPVGGEGKIRIVKCRAVCNSGTGYWLEKIAYNRLTSKTRPADTCQAPSLATWLPCLAEAGAYIEYVKDKKNIC